VLKQKLAGDIIVHPSGQLVHTLTEHDLVEELRLMVYPLVLGQGLGIVAWCPVDVLMAV
jgi:dihydrofolate reductase